MSDAIQLPLLGGLAGVSPRFEKSGCSRPAAPKKYDFGVDSQAWPADFEQPSRGTDTDALPFTGVAPW